MTTLAFLSAPSIALHPRRSAFRTSDPSPFPALPLRHRSLCMIGKDSSRQAPRPVAQNAEKLDRVVCKFGGSSLADSTRLKEVTNLVKLQIRRSNKMPVVILSAMGPSTNELLNAGERALTTGIVDMSSIRMRAYEACDAFSLDKQALVDPLLHNVDELLVGIKFIKELSPRTLDYLVSFGERLSVRIFAAHLRQNEDIEAVHVDAFDAGFITNSNFKGAQLLDSTFENIHQYFESRIGNNRLAVVTGFIAKDEQGNITTLGRGGSDLTAATIGAALGTTEVQVWKDVDGIMSTDPRIVGNAVPVPSISFEEAAEMAYFGAKVLHPSAMQPAMKRNIPVRVKNSYNPDHPGTVITQNRAFDEQKPVTAISLKKNVQIVDIISTRMLGAFGFLAEVFNTFARHEISIDMVATSEVSISVTLDTGVCDNKKLLQLQSDLGSAANVSFSKTNKAIVSMVSDSSRSCAVVGRAITALDRAGVRVLMISHGASKYNISITIEGNDAKKAVQVIHEEFFH